MLRSSAAAALLIFPVLFFVGARVLGRVPGAARAWQSRGFLPTSWSPPSPTLNHPHTAGQATNSLRNLPKYQMMEGQEVVLERVATPVGILLLFHGCHHSAIDWWDAQHACPSCIGLPEEKAIVKAAVARKYAVVAFSSMDRGGSRCWSLGTAGSGHTDANKTARSWETVRAAEGWQGLPVYALGASSGGAFVGALPQQLKLQGACIQIASYPGQAWGGTPVSEQRRLQPPVLFVHMERDQGTAGAVRGNVAELIAKNIVAEERVVKPQPLTAVFLSDRIEGMTRETSSSIHGAAVRGGMVGPDGTLLKDPRSTIGRWQNLLRETPLTSEISLKADASPVFEELNVAWAQHELISSTTDEMLDFFEAQTQ